MEYVEIARDALNWLAVTLPWDVIIESGALSGALAVLLVGPYRIVKRYFEHYKEVMTIVVGVGGVALTFGQYLLSTPQYAPQLAVLQGLAVAYGSQPFYKIVLKPLWMATTRAITKKVVEYNQALSQPQVALEPAGGIKGLEINDFEA